MMGLKADNVSPEEVNQSRSKRAMTENFQAMTPDPKSNANNKIETIAVVVPAKKATAVQDEQKQNQKRPNQQKGGAEAKGITAEAAADEEDQYEYEYYDEYYDEEEELMEEEAGGSHLSLQHQDSHPTQLSPETESDFNKSSRFSPDVEDYNKERDGRTTQGQSEYVDSPREQAKGIKILYI